jgi:non-heme chloroperoxidase
MQAGHRNTYEAISAFSTTDFRADLATIDIPTLVIHGDDDQIVPFPASGERSARLIRRAELTVYAGAPHGITDTRGSAGAQTKGSASGSRPAAGVAKR